MTAFRVFTEVDQESFARWSGDRNPMHMDALAARRTPAGAPVVHGIHVLLWALEQALADGASFKPPFKIRADFRKFVFAGEKVSLEQSVDQHGRLALRLVTSAGVVATFRVGPADEEPVPPLTTGNPLEISEPQEPTADEIGVASGSLALANGAGLGSAFPRLHECISHRSLAAIGGISFLVGMVCPGLHSILAAIDVNVLPCTGGGSAIHFATSLFDERFRLARMQVSGGGIEGSVDAFLRPKPVQSLTMEAASRLVGPQQFAGRRALVVGGSRGLGAATAKLLAAGGADVTITHVKGATEAADICKEVEHFGAGRCSALRLDVLDDFSAQLRTLPQPTDIYYFATPPIFLQKKPGFDRAVFDRFVDFYVDAFHRLCAHFEARTGETISVFYPSSIAVAERPNGLTEYAMAKAAGELLCEDLQRSHPNLGIRFKRLPRVLTDQTATVQPVQSAAPEEVMLPLLLER